MSFIFIISEEENMRNDTISKIVSMSLAAGVLFSTTTPVTSFAKPLADEEKKAADERLDQKYIVSFKKELKSDKEKKEKIMSRVSQSKSKKNLDQVNQIIVENLSKSEMDSLKNDPNVASVEEDINLRASDYMDWGITKIKADQSWNKGWTGTGAKVAILDTGIDVDHPDLVVTEGVSTVDDEPSFDDLNGHGTHVAGIVGSKNNGTGTVGVAPNSELYPVKVLHSDGSGDLSDILEGINWSISKGVDVINMSLGTPSYSSALEQAVNNAYNKGILVVAAAGNNGNASGTGDTVEYPARFPNTIAVSAVDQNSVRAPFSATGKKVEVSAPGVKIASTYPGGTYASMSGTSMASPYVAGELALLKERYPTYSTASLRSALQSSALDLGVKGRDALYGYGMIQAPIR
jgi:minor extracellular protease Epr